MLNKLAERHTDEFPVVQRAATPHLFSPYLIAAGEYDIVHSFLKRYVFEGQDYFGTLPVQTRVIVDVGSALGLWCRAIALRHSDTIVYGVDLSTDEATERSTPANCYFIQRDITRRMPFPDHTVDYLHQSFVFGDIAHDFWPVVASEYTRVMRPGGYIDLIEADHFFVDAGPVTSQFLAYWQELCQKKRGNSASRAHLNRLFQAHPVEQKTLHFTCGKSEANRFLLPHLLVHFMKCSALFRTELGISDHAFDALFSAVSHELRSRPGIYEVYFTRVYT